jgi:MraZ protein
MPLFMSKYTNKVDRKGRVSVPAQFRAALPSGFQKSIVSYQAVNNDAIECCDLLHIEKVNDSLEGFAPYSDEHNEFSLALMSGLVELSFDGNGRIILPQDLMKFAGIGEYATFAGKGKIFQIWEPEAFKKELEKARSKVKEKRSMLRFRLDNDNGGDNGRT